MKYTSKNQFGFPKITTGGNFQYGKASIKTNLYIEPHSSETPSETFQPELNDEGHVIAFTEKRNALNRIDILKKLGTYEEVTLVKYIPQGSKNKIIRWGAAIRGNRTINRFIQIIEKIEQAYPEMSPKEIAISLAAHHTGFGNDTGAGDTSMQRYLWMLGIPTKDHKKYIQFTPVEGILSAEDLSLLHQMVVHDVNTGGKEIGIVKDNGGNYLAAGHLLTSMAAGYKHLRQANPANPDGPSSRVEFYLSWTLVGSYVDNILASGISGDLGQSISEHLINKSKSNTRVGPGTEATSAELISDIDGTNLGISIDRKQISNEQPVSQIFRDYYNSVQINPKKNRYDRFDKVVGTELLTDEINFFMRNWMLKLTKKAYAESKVKLLNGINNFVYGHYPFESRVTAKQFDNWKKDRSENETGSDNINYKAGEVKPETKSKVLLLEYTDEKYEDFNILGKLSGGTKFIILNTGYVSHANHPLTRIHVTSGPYEGTSGYITNHYVREIKTISYSNIINSATRNKPIPSNKPNTKLGPLNGVNIWDLSNTKFSH